MSHSRVFWILVLPAAAVLAVTMGIRQSLGLFLSPINTATGLGIVNISFAMAISQLVWGISQPLFGMWVDKVGSFVVIVIGALMMVMGLTMIPLIHTSFALYLAIGLLFAAGAGAGSFSILIGSVAQRLPQEHRSTAAGIINAGGSLGQFIFAPMTQSLISSFNWVIALFTLAISSVMTIIFAIPLRDKKENSPKPAFEKEKEINLKQQLRFAFLDRSYICLNIGFFTCGFHIAFLVTHLPGEVSLCGLPASVGATSLAIIGLSNIFGSLFAGWLGKYQRMKMILFWMYLSRAIAVAIYIAVPASEEVFYLFAAVLGFTWLATVPPTAGLVGKLFGVRYMATLFGFSLFSHQIGGFFGAWLGGISFFYNGNYEWMWYADICLAVLAALANLPIKENPVKN